MPSSQKVLLVEADSISNQLLSFSLQREGFEVIQAENASDGLHLARTSGIDAILSEVHLPDIDGYEMCRQLRDGWNTKRIPILFVTTLGSAESRIRGLLAGADDFLTKPYDLRELVLRIRRLIATYANNAQLHPLTKLPNSQIIRAYIEEICLPDPKRDWALLQIDLNRFKVYNHVYGFQQGDNVLKLVSDLLCETVHGECEGGARFIGHEGGDDFVAVVPAGRADDTCEKLITEFDRRIEAHYPLKDRHKGRHVLADRAGNPHLVPHLSLAIGVVTGDLCSGMGYHEIRETATIVTGKAKVSTTSSAYINRRHAAGRSTEIVKHKIVTQKREKTAIV